MQRQQFSPDIQIKYDHLLTHMNEKNKTIDEFIRILKEICDAEMFYSRNLDKFANSISKLLIGKDPLKERIISAKSQQAMNIATSIKDDMLPFIEKEAINMKQQTELRNKQQFVKDVRSNMQRKLRQLFHSQISYKRSYDALKRLSQVDTRQSLQERQKAKKVFAQRELTLLQNINIYNHTVQEYMLQYTGICQKLSDIQTKRKRTVRDGINKYMIFQMNNIKNIEYNIPRYMKSLQKMDERLIIQDKVAINQVEQEVLQLAKISPNNYIMHLNDREKVEIPHTHKKLIELKKFQEKEVSSEKYHFLMSQLNKLLNHAMAFNDIRILKEVVYFSKGIHTVIAYSHLKESKMIGVGSDSSIRSNQQSNRKTPISMSLLEGVLCHDIFKNESFWNAYQQKIFDIIQRQRKSINLQQQQVKVSLSFLAGDFQFMKLVSYHALPTKILSKFILSDEENSIKKVQSNNINEEQAKKFQRFIEDIQQYI